MLRFGLRLFIVGLAIAILLFASLRIDVVYASHRASSMLTEASCVQIGTSEATVLPLVERYGGFRLTPEPLPPKAQWIDKDEYDYQEKLLSDYSYRLEISPFGNAGTLKMGRLTGILSAAREAVPSHMRAVLGMRNWGTAVELSMRKGLVQSVSASTLVEGSSGWLGQRWELAEGMPHHEMRQGAYAIGSANLTMLGGGGTMIENYLTPKASEEEMAAARDFNGTCLTSTRACDGMCNIAPRALEYLERHPDVAWNIIPPKCH